MAYLRVKNPGGRSGPIKKEDETFLYLTEDQFHHILDMIDSDVDNRNRVRDQMAVFLGFHLALRASECAKLNRHAMRLLSLKRVLVPTLKQARKVTCVCRGPLCAKKSKKGLPLQFKASRSRIGESQFCARCGYENTIYCDEKNAPPPTAPEKSPSFLEPELISEIEAYMSDRMRPDQQYLFEPRGRPGRHVSAWTLQKMFNTYAMRLDKDNPLLKQYSWHSLRHGRGVQVYENLDNIKSVQDALRHASQRSSEIYVHLSPKGKDIMREKMSKSFRVRSKRE